MAKAQRVRRAEPRVEVVSFDLRRNLINILGDEHYPYAEYLYHELAANAWDEDATELRITEEALGGGRGRPSVYDIRIQDNGNGMDYPGLQEYFRVGESAKPNRGVSERFQRPLIGKIGVGKVAILKVARRWTITTERHLNLPEPVRLTVHVDVDAWISGSVPAFAVQYIKPTGNAGTELVLEGVRTKLREDRILRMLQRLPLGGDFMIWRGDKPIPPRQWSGIDRIEIDDVETEWTDEGVVKRGRLNGEIWIRPVLPKRQQAYLVEPASEKDGLKREPAGIEVRVNRDVITREFFGHETHAHSVNRIWGWVEAPWLPILGNRTNYLVDSPAGQAFYKTVKAFFDRAYQKVRYENEKRALDKRRQSATEDDEGSDQEQPDPNARSEPVAGGWEEPEVGDWLASKYGEVISQVLRDKPEFAPVLQQPAAKQRGRPANDRIYPVRPTDQIEPFEPDPYGKELATVNQAERLNTMTKRAVAGRTSRTEAGHRAEQIGEVTVNTAAGVRLRFVPLGGLEAPYRWNLVKPEELTLDINTDHKLYKETGRPGGALHRLHCAWLVSLALAELSSPSNGHYLADFIESLSYELVSGWSPRR